MDKENANPIVEVGSKHDASIFGAVPSRAMSGSDVGSDEEEEDVKTRQVLRRLQVGQYISYFAKDVYRFPFCTRRLGATDFNRLVTHAENISTTFPKVGMTVNVHSFRAKHRTLGMHLRSLQRVEISAGCMPPLKPKAPKGSKSNKWRQSRWELKRPCTFALFRDAAANATAPKAHEAQHSSLLGGARSGKRRVGEIQDLSAGRQPAEETWAEQEEGRAALPSEESYPAPPIGYRVSFVDHLIRGLSAPIHEFLRGLLFVYGLQLHHLTPNSILHIAIFITLCESFLGVHPNWALWKRIFLLRRNGSHNIAYNIGGVVICVRPDVEYFDVKFPDFVQGWRKRWLYVREECPNSQEFNIAPFDGSSTILRRQSWDAEATEDEKMATEVLMTRIHELKNTRGQELSGIQITAYFLRIRVQPLQARKNPLWMYAGDKDVDRLSMDLSVKDLEKLVRKISSLSKKDAIP
ncbi:hypothetical protein QYE76_031788 [Lolium multiflorum]|uniref:Transposase (putative) gypsy type domain-containing protein n=1 Tax=Lolium multiflorum TaxID=4521 RepID=A0AAD8QSA8_LOLMU|nr:hypothetical protein QYE76_031788 [Lolium multiflorum]